MEEYVRKLFELINQFKSTANRHIIQEDWLLKTINHLEKLEKKLKHKKLKKQRKLSKDNSNLYFAYLTRFDSHDEFLDFRYYFSKFCNSFIPDFENLYYLIHLNDNMNGILLDSNLDEEIVLDITGFHDEEVLNKQNVSGCDHSESHLSEEGIDLFTLNGRISGKFVSKNVLICLSGSLLRQKSHYCPKDSPNDEKEFDRNKFKPKSTFNPRNKDAAIEIYLSSLEEKLMNIEIPQYKYNNLTREEWSALYNLKNDRSIVIKSADKGYAVVVWDRDDYIKEAEEQLGNKDIYEEVCNDPRTLISTIHEAIEKIRKRGGLNADTVKYFMVKYPKFARFYLLPKIHKRLHDVLGRPVISNCGYYTENISSFLDFHLQPLTREVKSYIKDTKEKDVTTSTLVELAEVVLKNNVFTFM